MPRPLAALIAALALLATAAAPATANPSNSASPDARWSAGAARDLNMPTGTEPGATASVRCPGTTVVGSFTYLGFGGPGQTTTNEAAQIVLQDGVPMGDTHIAKSVDGDHFTPTDYGPLERPADGKTHQYQAVTTWAAPGGDHYASSNPLTCAAVPVPTFPGCDGHTYPVGTPPPACPATTPTTPTVPPAPPTVVACDHITCPVTTTPPTSKPPRPHRFKCVCRVHIIKPNPNTPGSRHGVHPFGARLITSGHITRIDLTITALKGPPNKVGRPSCTGTRISHRSAHDQYVRIDLYDLTAWRHCLAWGKYRLTFAITVHVRDAHGHTHICHVKRTVDFFNHDPDGHDGP